MAFRVAPKDVEYFKRSTEDDYKRGEIKAPTLAALAKHLMYRHLRMLKDIEKARRWKNQQPRTLHNSFSEVEETSLETATVNYLRKDDYDEDNDEGSSIKEPLFNELFPDWQERIARIRYKHSEA